MATNETSEITPQAQEPANDENSALVEAFKAGLQAGSQVKAAPVIEEPKPKYPMTTDNGATAPSKSRRYEVPTII